MSHICLYGMYGMAVSSGSTIPRRGLQDTQQGDLTRLLLPFQNKERGLTRLLRGFSPQVNYTD
jgi:hypothetical protein